MNYTKEAGTWIITHNAETNQLELRDPDSTLIQTEPVTTKGARVLSDYGLDNGAKGVKHNYHLGITARGDFLATLGSKA